mmetsp:Transcript_1490/g.3510  ORF Transcript_1490/g.3510 Transcript_1490/m.3510 type:complete len:200 (+) Transcript_1490:285-884(+)
MTEHVGVRCAAAASSCAHTSSAKERAVSCTASLSWSIHTSKSGVPPMIFSFMRPASPSRLRLYFALSSANSDAVVTAGSCARPSSMSASSGIASFPFAYRARSSLHTFCMRTELSPSAVMPAWLPPMASPKRLIERYPCPPHRSRQVTEILPLYHVTSGLMAQHRIRHMVRSCGATVSAGAVVVAWYCALTMLSPAHSA